MALGHTAFSDKRSNDRGNSIQLIESLFVFAIVVIPALMQRLMAFTMSVVYCTRLAGLWHHDAASPKAFTRQSLGTEISTLKALHSIAQGRRVSGAPLGSRNIRRVNPERVQRATLTE